MEYLTALYFGVFLSVVLQLIYERFFINKTVRLIFAGVTAIASVIFYLLVHASKEGTELFTRTSVIFFILFLAFLWVPAIRSRFDFNQSFMAVFKSFFEAVFFNGILFLGIVLIVVAINGLILPVDRYHPYEHSANLVFLLLAPVYFLSLIPAYPKELREEDELYEEKLRKATVPARFLETLVSYIIIPIAVVYTIILLLYIALHIMGDFWTNNLLEPLLISYSIAVIMIYLLAARMSNLFAKYFRMVFPKILVPVVLFQTVSSIIKGINEGVTYGRYYVILFGTFAMIAGILFCILPVRKNGVIVPILIFLALVSIIPPCDAFTVSRFNQVSRLEAVLKENQMLEGKEIIPNPEISKKDQETIISSVNYLDRFDDTKKISWLSGYYESGNFEKTFGFSSFAVDKNDTRYIYISRKDGSLIPITGHDYLIRLDITSDSGNKSAYEYNKDGVSYGLAIEEPADGMPVMILKEGEQELVRFDTTELFDRFMNSETSTVDTGELTFTQENASAAITVIAQSISINISESGIYRYADVYVLVDIKG